MRKGQENIIRCARKYHMTDEAICLLSREDLTLDELTIIERYILRFRTNQNETDLVTEAERCINIMHLSRQSKSSNLFTAKILFGDDMSIDHDTLMGNRIKAKMPKIVQYFLGYADEVRFYALYVYTESLYMQLPAWNAVCLTRRTIQRGGNPIGLLKCNPALLDDFIINKANSIMYWMTQNCTKLPWSKLAVSNLYDWTTHSFPIEKKEYSKYIDTNTGQAIEFPNA